MCPTRSGVPIDSIPDHPSAAESVREDLDETLSVLGLNLPDALRRSLTTTNAAESLISSTRHVKGNVKRWQRGRRGGRIVVNRNAVAFQHATGHRHQLYCTDS